MSLLKSFLTIESPKSLQCWREGYTREAFFADLSAGITVAIVALPLAMAFAIASGAAPEQGLYTAIIAGFLISALGGSRHQIGGPTGAFVVIIYAVIMRHGYDGLLLATFMAGIMLVLMGLFRLGTVIKFIPYPVTTGFTAGIALIIFVSQIKDVFGMQIETLPADFIGKLTTYSQSLHTISLEATVLAIVGILLILACRRYTPKIPGPIVVVILGAVAVWLFQLPVETIESRFGAIPSTLPTPSLPVWSFEKIRAVFPDALTIALLAAIESLLSAVVADGMTGHRHKSNTELIAQGIANIASALFKGIPATGAIARTATNIKSGARTPVAGMLHAFFLLLIMLFLAPLIVKIPLAALAAILVVVAWNMSEIESIKHLMKAPRSDVLVLVTTFALTVLIDLTVAVQVGVLLASLLFIKRISEVSHISRLELQSYDNEQENDADPDDIRHKSIPDGVEVYEINGPFFFGVADRLGRTLDILQKPTPVFIVRMRHVPVIDATGMHALEEFYERCRRQGTQVVLSGVRPQLKKKLERFGFIAQIGNENVLDHIDRALERAHELLRA
ncbi:SulP family inorganic anion transporter [Chrysiogenes arsenatis]|uniref:SulP family inorganic anion transporter n=1 Tax=Chrysiogenes arsenatis TaxID=309797 RepID=UPI000402CC44|nr:sulfate permease [Chrysiogenes arsenatis]